MASIGYTLNGRPVLQSDLVLGLTVSSWGTPYTEPFYKANLSRIDETGGIKDRLFKSFHRTDRERTLSLLDATVVLTFSHPPTEARPYFAIGRDPASCEVVCADTAVDDVHIKLCFEDDHLVLYDVSSGGSWIALDDRGLHPTCPRPGEPYRCILPPGCRITLKIPGHEFVLRLPRRNGPELSEFREWRDDFLASCSHAGPTSVPPPRPPPQTTLSPSRSPPQREWRPMYWLESRLGEGGFGTVYRVRRLHDWAVLAAKQLHPAGDDDGSLVNEIRALQRLRHKRVVEYADWYEDSDNPPQRSVLVMEYCPLGSLHDLLAAAPRPFSSSETAIVLKQIAEGLAYLHGSHVTHRDLKPANILVRRRKPLSLALSDFGLASLKREEDRPGMYGRCGTALYSAPEMFGNCAYSPAVDIWGMGVVGLELLQKRLPMPRGIAVEDCPREIATMAEVMYRRYSNCWPILEIVVNMLAWGPRDRPPADKCVSDINRLLSLSR
ncbi:kinase-like domain-containing protein [Parachaetomium inaequale]|uniref:Kinase-like domain-containing protein n=1 Tax=Parachaetomium inaequale TaxID=2588326 RepID=A0AAN6SMH1_9PEZI|nr:kinase-like domain-containing protein [Parachaetomium inaequale]